MIISAPAKINLTLNILGKREDGFHELETLMIPIKGLADELEITPASTYSLECDTVGVPLDETNLVTRAVRAFEQKTGRTCRYRVQLRKAIPHGAGLGGGSSDAASMVLALNELEQSGLTLDDMSNLVAEFGSDTSFFIYQQACWCRGRGERVTPVAIDVSGYVVLLKPAFGVSTPSAFRAWSTSQRHDGICYDPQAFEWGSLYNDLERPVFEKHLFLAEVKRWLMEQPEVTGALMSGSGSTMFALVSDKEAAQRILSGARKDLDPTLWGCVAELDM